MRTATVCSRQRISFGLLVMIFAAASMQSAAQNAPFTSHNDQNGGTLSGLVITSSGSSKRDALITLRAITGQTLCTAFTDEAGSFHCPDVPAGIYQLIVSSEGNEQSIDISVANVNPEITITLSDGHTSQDQSNAVSVSELMVPSKARKSFRKATERFKKADLAGARSEVDKALEMWPRFAAALTLRGFIKEHSTTPQDAVNDFNAALDVDRSYGLAYIGLAANYNDTGDFDKALSVLDRGTPYITLMWQSHYEISKALLGKRAFARALQEASRASTLFGDDTPGLCFVKAQAYLNLGNARAAREQVETFLKKNSNRPGVERLRQLLATLIVH